jgi:hypothetical protein
MVAFTAFASAISIALLATTANAVPTVLTARQPPTTSAIDFTLYKTTQAGDENQCWFGVDIVHLAPADIGTCYTAVSDFYVLNIDHLATGYNCGGFFPQLIPSEKGLADCDFSERLPRHQLRRRGWQLHV